MGYPTFKVILRVGYGMGYAKWDMQEEVSQAGQIGFGEVKWERPAWPSGSSRCLYRIGLQAISAPVPRPLSLPLPAPPALCPCFCLLPLNHQQSSTHPCVTHVRPLDEATNTILHGQDQQSNLHPTVTQGPATISILFTTRLLVDGGPLVNIG